MRAAQSGFLGIALNWADLAFFLAVAILPPFPPGCWRRGTNSLFFSCFREREREERRRVHHKREEKSRRGCRAPGKRTKRAKTQSRDEDHGTHPDGHTPGGPLATGQTRARSPPPGAPAGRGPGRRARATPARRVQGQSEGLIAGEGGGERKMAPR